MPADALFWDKIAEKYSRSPISDMAAYDRTLERVTHYLRPDHRVLELGCGTGTTAVKLAPHVADMIATDVSQKMVDIGIGRAREAEVGNLRFAVAQPGTAPEGPFDVVTGFNLFHLLADQDQILEAVRQRLKPGGMFISKTPCLSDTRSAVKRLAIRLALPVMQRLGKAPSVVQFMTVAAWQRQIEAAGFEIVETGSYPDDIPNRFVVARRC